MLFISVAMAPLTVRPERGRLPQPCDNSLSSGVVEGHLHFLISLSLLTSYTKQALLFFSMWPHKCLERAENERKELAKENSKDKRYGHTFIGATMRRPCAHKDSILKNTLLLNCLKKTYTWTKSASKICYCQRRKLTFLLKPLKTTETAAVLMPGPMWRCEVTPCNERNLCT